MERCKSDLAAVTEELNDAQQATAGTERNLNAYRGETEALRREAMLLERIRLPMQELSLLLCSLIVMALKPGPTAAAAAGLCVSAKADALREGTGAGGGAPAVAASGGTPDGGAWLPWLASLGGMFPPSTASAPKTGDAATESKHGPGARGMLEPLSRALESEKRLHQCLFRVLGLLSNPNEDAVKWQSLVVQHWEKSRDNSVLCAFVDFLLQLTEDDAASKSQQSPAVKRLQQQAAELANSAQSGRRQRRVEE